MTDFNHYLTMRNFCVTSIDQDWLSQILSQASANAQPLLTKPTAKLPANIKRRCSHACKLALESALSVAQNHQLQYAVFGSEHGELARSISLFKQIVHRESLSPMAFTQSVHNSAAGLYGIIQQVRSNITAIAAGSSTFVTTVLDGLLWLSTHPDDQVLVTIFDDCLPPPYDRLCHNDHPGYALSFILSREQSPSNETIGLHYTINDGTTPEPMTALPDALAFICWLQAGYSDPLCQSLGDQTICWYQ